jgi:predicted dehydrogenase
MQLLNDSLFPPARRLKRRGRHLRAKIISQNSGTTTERNFRWGIIGLGAMADEFVNALTYVHNAEVVAVASRDIAKAKRFAKAHSVANAYGSYLDMLMDPAIQLDVVYIATPVRYHYAHVKLCLEHGYNTLCEKPITDSAAQFTELCESASQRNLFMMEAMWLRCLPTYRTAVKWVSDGRIGPVELIRVDLSKDILDYIGQNPQSAVASEGVLLDYGVYPLAFPSGFIGGPFEVKSVSCRRDLRGVDRHWAIILRASGVDIAITISSEFDGAKKAAVVGAQGRIEFSRQFNRTNTITLIDDRGRIKDRYRTRYAFDGFEYEIYEVHNALATGALESECVSWTESLQTLQLIDRLRDLSTGAREHRTDPEGAVGEAARPQQTAGADDPDGDARHLSRGGADASLDSD